MIHKISYTPYTIITILYTYTIYLNIYANWVFAKVNFFGVYIKCTFYFSCSRVLNPESNACIYTHTKQSQTHTHTAAHRHKTIIYPKTAHCFLGNVHGGDDPFLFAIHMYGCIFGRPPPTT